MRVVFFIMLIISVLFSSENVKDILNEIEKKEDLSLKTRQESTGISYVITRYQLDMMQAKYLRDILKNTVIGYDISRYGVLDPWTSNNLPYSSSGIRIFIDNQEITTARYDNGLFLLGNLNLSFVDHIEVYYLSPSYRISTEPAYVIVKLFSKEPKRDEGRKISFSYGTYGSNSAVYDYADSRADYYMHISRSKVGHEDVAVDDKTLSRDDTSYHFLWKGQVKDFHYLLNAIYQNQDPFMGLSADGKLDSGEEKYKEVHFGVEKKLNNFRFKYTVDYMNDKTHYFENTGLYIKRIDTFPYYVIVRDVSAKGYGLVNTLKFDNEQQYNSHKILYGLSLRNKKMNYYSIYVDNNEVDYKGIKTQNIATLFLEDNIEVLKNHIITFGYEFSRYFNDVVKDCNLHQYKVASTYLFNKNNIMKLSFQHLEYSVPPYLYKTFYGSNELKPQKNDVIIAKYKKFFNKKNEIELVAFYGKNKNYPVMRQDGTLISSDKDIYLKLLDLKYHKNYNILNDLIIDYIFINIKNSVLKNSHSLMILNTHRYKKFDFFENIVYKNYEYDINGETSSKHGVDVSLGAKYNYKNDLSFSLKVENLFNSRYKNSFFRVSDYTTNTLDKVDIQLIERKVTFGMEYWF